MPARYGAAAGGRAWSMRALSLYMSSMVSRNESFDVVLSGLRTYRKSCGGMRVAGGGKREKGKGEREKGKGRGGGNSGGTRTFVSIGWPVE